MTGRRLYDLFCDTRLSELGGWPGSIERTNLREAAPVAWPYLPRRERNLWNALARRLKGVKR